MYLMAVKLFLVISYRRWQGWKWIVFFMLWLQKSQNNIMWLAVPDKIHLLSSLLF